MLAARKISTACCECGCPDTHEYEYDLRKNRWVQDALEKDASGIFEFMCPLCVKGINEGKGDE